MDQNKHQAVAETVAKRKKKEQFSLRKAAKNLSVQGIKELVQSADKRKVDVGPGHVVKRSQESGSTTPASSSIREESRRRCSHPPSSMLRHGGGARVKAEDEHQQAGWGNEALHTPQENGFSPV